MIEIFYAIVGILGIFVLRLTDVQSPFRKVEYSLLTMFIAILLISAALSYYITYPNDISIVNESIATSSVHVLAISTNTLYQNTNTLTSQIIYATTGGSMQGYLGATSANMLLALNSSTLLSGVVGAILIYKNSVTLIVPPLYYYKFNYTGYNSFVEVNMSD